MDRAARIEQTFVDILIAESRIDLQKRRIATLDEHGMPTAASCARGTLTVMMDRLLALRVKQSAMVDTVRLLEKAPLVKAGSGIATRD